MTAMEAIAEIGRNWPSTSLGKYTELIKALNLACNSLMRDVPRAPIERICWPDDTVETGLCPRCNEGCNSEMNYCDYCGQALDWSDTT